MAPHVAGQLQRIHYASVAVVTLAFDARTVTAPTGSGVLVPAAEDRFVKAVTATSTKWGWYAEAAPGVVLLRASVGRYGEQETLQRDDHEIIESVRRDLGDVIGIAARPVDARVTRWGGSLPQYAVGHLVLVEAIRAGVAALPALAVCGAAYDGVGIPACIASGRRAAGLVLRALGLEARGE